MRREKRWRSWESRISHHEERERECETWLTVKETTSAQHRRQCEQIDRHVAHDQSRSRRRQQEQVDERVQELEKT